jgi:cyclic pyranopterin phosphate synthase
MLKDKYGRVHDYLRISLTDKCNLRCFYCMPAQPDFMPNSRLMSADEILKLAEIFVRDFCIKKIRLTGGEPLIRSDLPVILRGLKALGVELGISTNGVLLDRHFELLKEVGIKSLNISLDSLEAERFREITRRGYFESVMRNIREALDRDFEVKLNVVVVRGRNEHEVIDFVRLTKDLPLAVRFIEFMPFHTNGWEWEKVFSMQEMMALIAQDGDFLPVFGEQHATSKDYRMTGHEGTFGFISTITSHFCQDCNRLRLTADGKLRNCLFANNEHDLLGSLRSGDEVSRLIEQSVKSKAAERGGLPEFSDQEAVLDKLSTREMVKIGG